MEEIGIYLGDRGNLNKKLENILLGRNTDVLYGKGSRSIEVNGKNQRIDTFEGRISAYVGVCEENGLSVNYGVISDSILNNKYLDKNNKRQGNILQSIISNEDSDFWDKKYGIAKKENLYDIEIEKTFEESGIREKARECIVGDIDEGLLRECYENSCILNDPSYLNIKKRADDNRNPKYSGSVNKNAWKKRVKRTSLKSILYSFFYGRKSASNSI